MPGLSCSPNSTERAASPVVMVNVRSCPVAGGRRSHKREEGGASRSAGEVAELHVAETEELHAAAVELHTATMVVLHADHDGQAGEGHGAG